MIISYYTFSQTFTLGFLQNALSKNFGFVFLQDQDMPFFAFLPKLLSNVTTQQCYVRQADFSYHTVVNDLTALPSFEPKSTSCKQNFCGFTGGYIAFFSYDHAAAQQNIKIPHPIQPASLIGEYDIFLKKIGEHWQLFIDDNLLNHSQSSQSIAVIISALESEDQISTPRSSFRLDQVMTPRWSRADYKKAFSCVQDYLHAGDCYQINLTQEFLSHVVSGSLVELLPELLDLSQAPYAGYLKFQDFELLSCSPELFIEFHSDGMFKTRPIKGTLPRHQNVDMDTELKQQLANSDKDRAENLMIVDLLRNDLSVFAQTGSVQVSKLFEIESFAQVHHMVSEIQAKMLKGQNVFDVLQAALPGGSITGAPKIRAMQIIDELEGHARGAYCGSLGYFNYDGSGRFNILIRTLQRYGNRLSVWAGGGITVASNVDAEYQECLDKVSALLNFLNQYAPKS